MSGAFGVLRTPADRQQLDAAATARLITDLENRGPGSEERLGELYRAGGRARTVGVTGPPGSGKSTLCNGIVAELRKRDFTVAVVAVDPSSSLTGGAILGDRIRMQGHALDPGVFVRSMSSRGAKGGIARATLDAVTALDAGGWDWILVETVGVGQADLDVMRITDTLVVVSVPGLGDDIQAIKAGLLEVADVHVVNKADKPEASKTVADLVGMLALSRKAGIDCWDVPVLSTSALDDSGVPELVHALDAHRRWLDSGGERSERRQASAAAQIELIAQALMMTAAENLPHRTGYDALVAAVAARRLDPYGAASKVVVAGQAAEGRT